MGQRLYRACLPVSAQPAIDRGPTDAEAVRHFFIGDASSLVGLDDALSKLLRVCSRHLNEKAASRLKTSRPICQFSKLPDQPEGPPL